MKKNIITVLFLLPIVTGIIFTSCKDDFTEKDVLNAQQTIDLSILVYDAVTDSGLVDAAVSIYNNGAELTEQTDELGFANFSNIKIAEQLFFRIQKEGYSSIRSTMNIDITNFRQGQYSAIVPMYSLTNNTATITGKLEIETDMTNDETEIVPEGTEVYAYLDAGGDALPVEFTATTDADGYYELVVPADNYGVDYEMRFPTLEQTQTIAKNGDEGDPDFPETFPSIVDINTVFNPVGTALTIPSVPSLYAYVDPNATSDEIAIIYNVDVNNDGEITDIDFSDYGDGYTADSVDVTVVSLFEGSGAEIKVEVNGGSLYEWAVNIIDGGTGYPDFSSANRGGTTISFTTNVTNLKSGEIRVVDGDYGCGTMRETEIQ